MNDFRADLAWSEQCHLADWWEPYYRGAFPTLTSIAKVPGPSAAQRAGVDKFVYLNGGKRVAVDEKVRRSRPPNDILLEICHVPKVGSNTWPGWIEKPNQFTDYLAIGFEQYRVAFFFPFLTLQAAWTKQKEHWKRQFGVLRAENKDYWTHSCAVPTEILLGYLLDAMRVQVDIAG